MHNEGYSIRYLFDWIKWITKKKGPIQMNRTL